MIGLVQVGQHAMADRYTYVTQIGLYVALAWGAAHVVAVWSRRRSVCGVAAALVLALLMACAWRQTCFWHDSEALWTHTLACNPRNHVAHNLLGFALADSRKFDEAIAHQKAAIEINPYLEQAHLGLALVLANQGRLDEAMAECRKALALQPLDANAHYQLGWILASRGRWDEAIGQYGQVLQIEPAHLVTEKNLAWLRATCPVASLRNGQEALALAERANGRTGGKRPEVLDVLAAAYAELGRFPEAVASEGQALELAAQQNAQALVDVFRARLTLYQAGQPFRQDRPPSAPRRHQP